jgi:hypothetical protein
LKSKTFVDRNYILSKTPGNDQKFATINATSAIGYYVVFWNPSTWLRNRSKRVGARPLENERGMDIVFSQPGLAAQSKIARGVSQNTFCSHL